MLIFNFPFFSFEGGENESSERVEGREKRGEERKNEDEFSCGGNFSFLCKIFPFLKSFVLIQVKNNVM